MTTIQITSDQASYLWELGSAAEGYTKAVDELQKTVKSLAADGTRVSWMSYSPVQAAAEVEKKFTEFKTMAGLSSHVFDFEANPSLRALVGGIASQDVDRWAVLRAPKTDDGTYAVEF